MTGKSGRIHARFMCAWGACGSLIQYTSRVCGSLESKIKNIEWKEELTN